MATWVLLPTDFICFRERLDFVGHLMNYFYAKFGHPVLVVNFTGEQFNLCFYLLELILLYLALPMEVRPVEEDSLVFEKGTKMRR